MKALVSRLDLISLISKIQSTVSPKPAIPILGNVLIEAQDDELVLSTTDLTVSMRGHVDAKVAEEGAITLPARRFFQLVRELTTPYIELHASTPEVAYINAGSSHFKIQGMHKSEFPALPDLTSETHFVMSCAALKEMLLRTAFSSAREDSRQVLNGLLLQMTSNLATIVATDGKRLAKAHTVVEYPSQTVQTHIIPIKAVDEIVKILETKEDACKLTLMRDRIAVEAENATLITKLLSGQFPDLSRIIPERSKTPVILHREELISLLRQISLFISEGNSSVRFTFTSGMLHISAMSGEIGEGTVSMPVNYAGERLELAFNPHYFLDILRHCKDETVLFSISGPYNPGLITDSSSALFVIMPMRLNEN
ncbi:MAG: DNA polymerase III subunit beta [Chlamydiales bacterium]